MTGYWSVPYPRLEPISGGQARRPDLGGVVEPRYEILVGSVSHSRVHPRTSPERDGPARKSEPRCSGGRMNAKQRVSRVLSPSSWVALGLAQMGYYQPILERERPPIR
ncbi:hypothetical protein ACLKA7_004964 [Drosophila subpalustris]